MLNKYVLLLVGMITSMLIVPSGFAQESTNARITGTVVDENRDPVELATVILYEATDPNVTHGTVTDSTGLFAFNAVLPMTYRLEVAHVGYETFTGTPFEVSAGQSYTVPTILMRVDAVYLTGVTVESNRNLIEVQPDKTVLNVQGTINSTGSNALELLRKAPGVVVDNQDNVILAGKSGVKIYIDGKPSPLSVQDMAAQLRSMQSSQVDAIEIITNPGAKYEAEGNAGIINIRLRRDQNLGMNGTIDVGLAYGEEPKYSSTTTFNYRTRGQNTYGSYSFNAGKKRSWMDIYRIQNHVLYDEESNIENRGPTNTLRLGTDVFLSPITTLGVLLNGSINDGDWINNSFTPITNLETNTLREHLVAISDNDGIRRNGSANVNLLRDNREGTTLSIDADAAFFESDNATFQPNYYSDPGTATTTSENIYSSESPTDIQIYAAKLDYEQPLVGGTLGVGGKISEVTTDNRYGFYNIIGGIKEIDTDRTNDFDFRESITAGYASFSGKIAQFETMAGLRAEHTESRGILTALKPQDNDSVTRSYLDLFPSGSVVYSPSGANQFRLNYSRRIDRPSYQDLNPFEFRLTELTYQRGNPFLQPKYTNILSLSHTHNNVLNSSLTYSYTTDYFAQITDSTQVTRTFLETRNLGSQRTISATVSYPYSVTPWWNSFTNVTAFNTRNRGELSMGRKVDVNVTSATLYHQSSISLNAGWTLELSGWATTPTVWGAVYRVDSIYNIDAGFSKRFAGDKAVLKMVVTDVFETSPWHAVQDFSGLYMDVSGGNENRQLRLSFSYKLGNRQIERARERQTGTEEERNRIK